MSDWAQLTAIEPPKGMYPARLDDRGRAKVPVLFQQYFNALRDKRLFVTSLDRRSAQIFPMESWCRTEKALEESREQAARRVLFTANDLGAQSDMDAQGRIQFPPELRRELGIEDAPIKLWAFRGRIEVLSEAVYQAHRQRSMESAPQDIEMLEAAGLI